jgi:rod shape-determining protein MreD
VSPVVAVRLAAAVFVAAIVQVSAISSLQVLGATPDLLLVVLVSAALLRGAITGAIAGFAAGLIVDVATLGTLGVTALLLTLVGYWAGRYGETTGRGRTYAPLLAVLAATVLFGVGAYLLNYMLGEAVSAHAALLPVLPALLLNGILAYPVHGLMGRLVGRTEQAPRVREVELLV